MTDLHYRLIVGALVLAISLIATWISFWPERRFRREVAGRDSLDDEQFFAAYYADTDIPADIPRRLRPIYARFFEIEAGKLRPLDRDPDLAEIDMVDLIREIETKFGVAITDKDAERIDGSFDSIVRFLAQRAPLSK